MLSAIASAVPILFYLRRRSHLEVSRWLLFYLVLSLATELLLSNAPVLGLSLKPVLFAYYALQFLILHRYFALQAIPTARPRVNGTIAAAAMSVYLCASLVEKAQLLNSLGNGLFSLLLIAYCVLAFRKLITDRPTIYIEQSALFWVAAGMLLYFSGTFFLLLFGDYVRTHDRSYYYLLWYSCNNIPNIIMNMSIAMSFTRKYP